MRKLLGSEEVECFLHIPCVFEISRSPIKPVTPFFENEGEFFKLKGVELVPLVSGEMVEGTERFVVNTSTKGRKNLILEEEGGEAITMTFTARRGLVGKKDEKNTSAAIVESLADIEGGVILGDPMMNIEIRRKGEVARVRTEQGRDSVKIFVKVEGVLVEGELPLEKESPIERFLVAPKKDDKIKMRGSCTAEINVGEIGQFKFNIFMDSRIPVKAAYRLTNLRREAYLLDGQISGMKTFLPGENTLEFGFVSLAAGFQNLPGLEIEIVPTGAKQLLDVGPRFFAIPVAASPVVRE
jgi:hypothetical protein